MPATTTRRMPVNPATDRRIDLAYVSGGMPAAMSEAARWLGWTPTEAQVLIAVGRAAWRLGEARGDQAYQRRMSALGRPMPIAHPTAAPALSTLDATAMRGWGVELEFARGSGGHGQQRRIVDRLVAEGLTAYMATSYGHEVPHGWKMTSDATVTGGELVSPILRGPDGLRQMRLAARAIKDEGGVPAASQGVHVHHDVTDYSGDDLARLVRNLRWAEAALIGYVPRARYTGGRSFAARRLQDSEWDRYEREARNGVLRPGHNRGCRGGPGGYGWDRYVAWNWCAVLVQGSLEWRLLGHTLNAAKIATWVKVGQAVHAYTKAGHEFGATVDAEAMTAALVAAGHLSRREGERYVAAVATRRAA